MRFPSKVTFGMATMTEAAKQEVLADLERLEPCDVMENCMAHYTEDQIIYAVEQRPELGHMEYTDYK